MTMTKHAFSLRCVSAITQAGDLLGQLQAGQSGADRAEVNARPRQLEKLSSPTGCTGLVLERRSIPQ